MMLDVLTLYGYSSRSLSYPKCYPKWIVYRSLHNCSLPVKAPLFNPAFLVRMGPMLKFEITPSLIFVLGSSRHRQQR
jgi:hypothetical protein